MTLDKSLHLLCLCPYFENDQPDPSVRSFPNIFISHCLIRKSFFPTYHTEECLLMGKRVLFSGKTPYVTPLILTKLNPVCSIFRCKPHLKSQMLEHAALQILNFWRILTCCNFPTLRWCGQWQLLWQWLSVSDRRWLGSTMQKRISENPVGGGANCSRDNASPLFSVAHTVQGNL